MNRTLLYTVQRVLEKLNLDPVNSIADTEDSLIIAREAETTFYDMMARADWPDQIDLIEVSSRNDLNEPTTLVLEDEVDWIKSLRYDSTTASDNHKIIKEITWLSPEDFLEKVHYRNTDDDSVDEIDYKGTPIFVYNDRMPTYYTSFDNENLILDSYDSDEEDTLNGSKTICYAKTRPDWTHDDTFEIPVQENLFPLFLASLTVACSQYMTGDLSQEDERRAQRGISRMRRESARTEMSYFPRVNYGRKGNGLA